MIEGVSTKKQGLEHSTEGIDSHLHTTQYTTQYTQYTYTSTQKMYIP